MKVIISIVFLQIILWQTSFCQRETTYKTEVSTILGTEQTPFWMRANKYGLVPTKGNSLIMQIGAKSDYEQTDKKILWGYGVNLGGFAGMQNKFIIQEAYAKVKWKAFEIYAGRRKEIQGLVDTTLTSGSYIWSGNALPMPKIDLSIQNFASLGGDGLISIKGNYAHGWFESKRDDAVGVLLHQKSGYFRFGKPNWKFKFYSGLNHQAQWAGKALYNNNLTVKANGTFGNSLKDYLGVIMGKSNIGTDTTSLDQNSAQNRTGNHLGTIDLGFELNFSNLNILIYRQNIFEDGSLYYLNNISDGLNGLSISLKNNLSKKITISKVTIEFLNTLNQGGKIGSNAIIATLRGQDQYFNNGQYRDGWSYNKTSIGTPFILSNKDFHKLLSDTLSQTLFTNNRVQAYYLGLNGKINRNYNFVGKMSFSKNWGTYYSVLLNKPIQTSFYFSLNKEINEILGGVNGFINISGDFGSLFGNNLAIQIGFKKIMSSFSFLGHPSHKH